MTRMLFGNGVLMQGGRVFSGGRESASALLLCFSHEDFFAGWLNVPGTNDFGKACALVFRSFVLVGLSDRFGRGTFRNRRSRRGGGIDRRSGGTCVLSHGWGGVGGSAWTRTTGLMPDLVDCLNSEARMGR